MVMSLWQQRHWIAVEHELQRIVNRLRGLDPERIILFGSYARGDFHEGSDIDLVVIRETQERFLDRIGSALELIDSRMPVDVIVYTPAECEQMKDRRAIMFDAIEREGKTLYERPTKCKP
jgi:predicted nucleotidyltransferase